MEFEFGNFGEGLLFQEKFGELFALNRGAMGIEDKSIQKTKSLDSVALDELQAEIQGKLMEKREEFKRVSHRLTQISTTPRYIR